MKYRFRRFYHKLRGEDARPKTVQKFGFWCLDHEPLFMEVGHRLPASGNRGKPRSRNQTECRLRFCLKNEDARSATQTNF